MENKLVVAFLCGIMICFCSAEFTADMIYEILSSKLDILFFTIKNMRNEMNDLNEKVELNESGPNKDQNLEVKALFESLKAGMNDRFENLEAKITKKVDDLVQEARMSINPSVHDKFSDTSQKRNKESDQLKSNLNGMRKFMSSEKFALRKLNDQFENDTRKNIKNITEVFEGRIKKMEQVVAVFTNTSEIRIEEVETKMFAFESASWKGERGDIGRAGQKGQRGVTGEKGDTGHKGSMGERGIGLKGQKGQKGERRLSTGTWSTSPRLTPKPTLLTYLPFFKGHRGKTESRHSVYFSVSLKDSQELLENTIVKYNYIQTNQGNGYNSSTGVFTAPYSGVYLFLFFVRPGADDTKYYDVAYFKLFIDGVFRAYTIEESIEDGHDTMAGQAHVEYMYAGENAWIQTGDRKWGDIHHVLGYGTTFTGVLIN